MEYEQKEYASKGVAGAGLGLGIAGTAIGLLAAHNGSWFGNNNVSSQSDEICQLRMQNAILSSENSTDKKLVDVYTTLRVADKAQDEKMSNLASRVLALETSAPLREQIVVDQITALANQTTASFACQNNSILALQNTISNLTKTIIPIDNVCPQPMQRYNSWTAPTTPTNNG